MDQNDAFKEFVQLLIQEGIITEKENGDLKLTTPDTWVKIEEMKVCSCKKDSKKEEEILFNASKSPLVNFLWQILPMLDIAGIAGFMVSYLKPILPRQVNPKLVGQVLIKILPLLKQKLNGPCPKL